MALLNPPSSTAVVDVPDAQVAAYVAQGWRDASAPHVPVNLENPEDQKAPLVDPIIPDADKQEPPALVAPAGNASLEDWATYAMATGVPGESLDGLKREEIKQLLAG